MNSPVVNNRWPIYNKQKVFSNVYDLIFFSLSSLFRCSTILEPLERPWEGPFFHSKEQPTVSCGALVTELTTGKGVSVGKSKSTFAFFEVVGLLLDTYLQHTKPALGELFFETPSQWPPSGSFWKPGTTVQESLSKHNPAPFPHDDTPPWISKTSAIMKTHMRETFFY